MITLIRKLYQIHILKPKGFYHFVKSVLANGVNLMSVLDFSAKLNPNKIAIHSEGEIKTYDALKSECKKLAIALNNEFKLEPNQRVAIFCRNNLQAVQTLYALSRLGVHIYFLNTEISEQQLIDVVQHKKIDVLIYDSSLTSKIGAVPCQKLNSDELENLINSVKTDVKLRKVKAGELVILSGGTTGKPKSAKRKPSIGDFLNPLVALLAKLKLNTYQSVYIATPFYHGFGLASLIMSILLGSEIHLIEKFDAKKVCKMIETHQIEVVTLVPVMLKRIITEDVNALKPLKCIICGGAKLDQELVKLTLLQLGDVLYNLYGTTEAGFSILAEPKQLREYPLTIGRPIRGVSIKTIDKNGNQLAADEIGQIHLKNGWMMNNAKENWMNTDDLGYIDQNGLVFLAGRSDNMIISGGENVYPDEVENTLIQHPLINDVAVVGVDDMEFGQRLVGHVVLNPSEIFNETEILNWLKPKVARHQMPKKIVLTNELPRTAIGKVDKKALKLNK